MPITADLHIHSHYSRATSKNLTFEHLWKWAQLKGVHLLATGDIAHPGWLQEMHEKLEPAEEGLFRLKEEHAAAMRPDVPPPCQGTVRFMLGGEISNIYKKNGAVRKVHNLIFAPSLQAVEEIQARLEKVGNIRSDGRPILGLDSRHLLEIILEVDERCHLIPAHIWTPWFSLLGSQSGFDSVQECFDDLTPHIFALETGLSSDPPMNWRLSALDRYTLVSNSDAHSPQKLAREATLFNTELAYDAIFRALQTGDLDTFLGTVEFFPEEGKYHMDGHRKCGVCWHPQTTRSHGGRCTACGKPVTVGVLHRVEELADRPIGGRPQMIHPFHSLIPLPEILSEINQVGVNSKKVTQEYFRLLSRLGPELAILRELPVEEIAAAASTQLAEGIGRMRRGQVTAEGGYDGEYGVIKLFAGVAVESAGLQIGLFGEEDLNRKEHKEQKEQKEHKDESFVNAEDQGDEAAPLLAVAEEVSEFVPDADSLPGPLGKWLAKLNEEQRAAVFCAERALVIVAGPGTGKTRTLTVRIAHLIVERGVAPEAILAVTFTNKAAGEMAERLAGLVGTAVAARVTIATFHALGVQILREWSAAAGLEAEFTILGEEERRLLFKRASPELSEKEVDACLSQISAAKNHLITVDESGALTPIGDPAPDWDAAAWGANLGALYQRYEAALRQSHALDYDDLILRPVRLFVEDPEVLRAVQARLRWISVDEYQDVNFAQYRLLRLLADAETNLCVIGDPDQAIYGFRGADHRYFLSFVQDYPGARMLHLQRNYRSSQRLLDAATQVIAHNPDREALQLLADFADEVNVEIYTAPTDRAEAEYIVHQIEQMVGGTSYFSLDSGRVDDATLPVERSFGDFAVLYRLNAQAALLQEAFDRSGIPYQTVGRTPFYNQKPVQGILSYLWLLHNPRSLVHLDRVLAPNRPLRADLWQKIQAEVESVSRVLSERLRQVMALPGLAQGDRKRMAALAEFYTTVEAMTPGAVTGLIEAVHHFVVVQDGQQLPAEDLQRLLQGARPFEQRLADFLSSTMLQRETDFYDPRAGRVTLMTLHAAKGLEFPTVFIAGCEEGLLPYLPQNRSANVEEERRLFYVGMTRAQRRLIFTHARRRQLFGQWLENPLSSFVDDIERALLTAHEAEQRRPQKPQNVQLRLF
jgi:DNA helicase II / ATP-dependent DNA helicase PcrA